MSAEVQVTLADHKDVVTIPVAAVVETESEYFCWVRTAEGAQRRALQLGDSNDQFIVVEAGLKEGDEIVLNPLAYIEEAQNEALKPLGEKKADAPEAKTKPGQGQQRPKPADGAKKTPAAAGKPGAKKDGKAADGKK